MIEAYKIGVSLLLDDSKLLGPLNDALKALEKIQQAAKEAKAAMDGMAAGLRGAVSASASVAANMERAARAASTGGALMLRAPQTGFTMNGGSGGGNGAWNGLHIAGPDNRPTLDLPELPRTPFPWDEAGGLVWKGMNALMIVNMVVDGIGHLVEKARQLNDATVTLETRGLTAGEAQAAQDLSLRVALGRPGLRAADVVTDYGNLRGILGEAHSADPLADENVALPIIETVKAALAGKGFGSEKDMHRILRATELMGGLVDPETGHIDAKRFTDTLNLAYKMLTAGGGMFTPTDLLNMTQQAGPVARIMGPSDFMHYMFTAGLDMKGNRAGTALTALGRQVFGGKMTKSTAAEWERLGIIPQGSFKSNGPGAVILNPETQDMLTQSTVGVEGGLFGWIQNVIRPKLLEHGYDTQEKQNQELYRVFGTETARRLASLWLGNTEQVHRDVSLMDKNPDATKDLDIERAKSIGTNMGAFTAAFDNLLNSLEKANASPIISILQGLTSAVNALTAGSEAMQKLKSTDGGLTGPNAWWKNSPFSKDFWFGHDYGKGDSLVHKESYSPAGGGGPMVHTITYVQMDGRTIARAVSDQQARQATLPPSGTSRFDIRMNAPSPGQQWDT